ncbi:PP2C family serine/threonine-protein phosphatase [Nocardia sp. NPDC047654]|uniref:PP2C family serine/threonine-protein phosphatase n=1 Tax=Nocardia sp. NPDC047654 TaxID=3364314 RepID=UPI0037125E36
MQVATAQLAAQSDEDRVAVTGSSVVVLDGASSFSADGKAAGAYVDVLSRELVRRLQDDRAELPTILSSAIATTAARLSLQPGSAPSSTVAIFRVNEHNIEILILGDSMAVIGVNDGNYEVVVDERLTELNLPESKLYRSRLQAGRGYDDTHHAILAALQRAERFYRNTEGGYWIAEADPAAANHSLTGSYPRKSAGWAILATDGAAEPLAAMGIPWPEVAQMNEGALSNLLVRCREWESVEDPDGRLCPRSKRHDDKSIAVIRF